MSNRRHLWLAIAVFFVVAAIGFRPLFFRWNDLPTYERGSTPAMALADRNLNIWILGWVAHALVTHPGDLFQGNILYPASDTLAGSEHMLAHVPFTVPTYLLTGNSAYVLKVMMLESIVLTALAAYLLVRHHTGDPAAALVAGVLLTLTPWRYEPRGVMGGVAAEPQYLGFQFLPAALLFLALYLERGRLLAWLGFVAAMALQALASFYLGYLAFSTVPFYALVLLVPGALRTADRKAPGIDWRRAAGVAMGLAAAAAVVLPSGIPYLRLRRQGVVPAYSLDFVAALSAPPWSYLDANGVALIGPVAVAIAVPFAFYRLVQLLRGRRRQRVPAFERAAWILLAVGLVLGWGPYQEVAGWKVPLPFLALWKLVPGFSAMRGAGRYVIIVSLALCLVSGYALAALRDRLGRARWPVAFALIGITLAISSWHPVQAVPSGIGSDASPIYLRLAERPPGEPVLELPAKAGEDDLWGLAVDSRYMLASTVHWQPLLNGYTAYEAPSRYVLSAIANRLPEPDALDRLLSLVDVRWIVVHRALLDASQRVAFDAGTPGLTEVARAGQDVLYEVTARPKADRRAVLLAGDPGTSLEGTPRNALGANCRSGRLEIEGPDQIRHFFRKARFDVRVTNLGDCTWPGLGLGAEGLVMLEYQWLDGDTDTVAVTGSPGRLTADPAPGATLDEPLFVLTPARLGPYRLRVTLRQQGQAEAIAVAEKRIQLVGAGGT